LDVFTGVSVKDINHKLRVDLMVDEMSFIKINT